MAAASAAGGSTAAAGEASGGSAASAGSMGSASSEESMGEMVETDGDVPPAMDDMVEPLEDDSMDADSMAMKDLVDA